MPKSQQELPFHEESLWLTLWPFPYWYWLLTKGGPVKQITLYVHHRELLMSSGPTRSASQGLVPQIRRWANKSLTSQVLFYLQSETLNLLWYMHLPLQREQCSTHSWLLKPLCLPQYFSFLTEYEAPLLRCVCATWTDATRTWALPELRLISPFRQSKCLV